MALKNLINEDLACWGANKLTKKLLYTKHGLKQVIIFRKANYYWINNKKIRAFIYNVRLKKLGNKEGFIVPRETMVGPGFMVYHNGNITISKDAILGKHINIGGGVLIGNEFRGKRRGAPTIGDYVWISNNVAIVGNIIIGNDVLFAPNSYCNFDVPDHSIVIGNPGKIIHKENAVSGYIKAFDIEKANKK